MEDLSQDQNENLQILSMRDYDKRISDNLKALQKACGITNLLMAEYLGINPSSYRDMLVNRSHWRVGYLYPIADFFSVSIDDLCKLGEATILLTHTQKHTLKNKKNLKNYFLNNGLTKAYGNLVRKGYLKGVE
jgi:hypothetical protein